VKVSNNDNLSGITIVIPKEMYKKPKNTKYHITEDKKNYYCVFVQRINEAVLNFNRK